MRRELVLIDICSQSAIDSLRGSANCNHVYCLEHGLDFIFIPSIPRENASNPEWEGSLETKNLLEPFKEFLEQSRVPLRLACITREGWPMVLSLWYLYETGKIFARHKNHRSWCITWKAARAAHSRLPVINRPTGASVVRGQSFCCSTTAVSCWSSS
jgi:hypothetical protein